MLAILSDIHANLEALEAVLADIERRSIKKIYCLGDVVGYGPDPSKCVDLARDFQLCLTGNWEQFIGNSIANNGGDVDRLHQHHNWTHTQLAPDQIQFLSTLKTCHKENNLTFAHGSPLDFVNGYLFPEHVHDNEHMLRTFSAFDGLFICGHTHIPGVHTLNKYDEATALDNRFEPADESVIINVGSVGQPRDNDRRTCYVAFDGKSFEFIRLDYDWDTTQRKINDLGLPPTENGT